MTTFSPVKIGYLVGCALSVLGYIVRLVIPAPSIDFDKSSTEDWDAFASLMTAIGWIELVFVLSTLVLGVLMVFGVGERGFNPAPRFTGYRDFDPRENFDRREFDHDRSDREHRSDWSDIR